MAEATAKEQMQLLPEMLLKAGGESEQYPGFSLLVILQSQLVPPTGQPIQKPVVITWTCNPPKFLPTPVQTPGRVYRAVTEQRMGLRA